MQDKSAREALQTFAGGKGDVLLAYENEAITAQAKDLELDYVVPERDDPDREPDRGHDGGQAPRRPRPSSTGCATPEAQKIFASKGYRSVREELVDEQTYPTPAKLFKIDKFGGWEQGQRRVLRPGQGLGGQDRAGPGGLHCQVKPTIAAPATWPARRLPGTAVPRGPPRPRAAPLVVGGLTTAWLTLIVLLPLAAVVVRSFDDGFGAFWDAITNPQAVAAMELTLIVSLVVAAIDAVMGTLIAWVLVRDEFPGKSLVNALIDLPFALPTIVAGLTLLALYGPRGPTGINVAYTRSASGWRCCS